MAAESPMTFADLCSAVVLALATGYEGSGSDRTRDVPDARTIRYYTTLGLLDKPAGFQGRTALYHRKHLLQLVAIKRLQARGLTLSQIQSQLLGLSNAQLEKLAGVPKTTPGEPAASGQAASGRNQEFWKQPVTASLAEAQPVNPTATLTGVPLSSEVTLLLPAMRTLDAHDLEGLQSAAQPLLRWLQLRRILPDPGN